MLEAKLKLAMGGAPSGRDAQTGRRGGASEHKIHKVHRLLSASFNRAVRYGWIVANPCARDEAEDVESRDRTADAGAGP